MRSSTRHQVRRGVQPDPNAVRLEDAGEQRRSRALAVGAEDQDRGESAFGAAEGVERPLHPLEAREDPLLLAWGEQSLGAGR